jgi:hypothetical protein
MSLRRHVLNITLWGCTCDHVLETLSTNIFKCYLLHKTWSELLQNASCWLQNQRVLQIRYMTTALVPGPYELPRRMIALDSSFSLFFHIFKDTHTYDTITFVCPSLALLFVCLFVCLSSISEANEFHETFCIRVNAVQTLYFIIIYLSWSWATFWPVPVSRTQKSLQRSAMIPSASRGIV